MRRFIRCVSLIMIAAILLAVPVSAAENGDARASSYFACSSVYLYKTSALTFRAWFDVTGLDIMQEIGARTIKIQRSEDGESWIDVKIFSRADYSTMICANTARHASYVTYTGTPGYYYRAYIVLYAKDSNGSGEWYRYTSPIQLIV